jgi:hypothetical protein
MKNENFYSVKKVIELGIYPEEELIIMSYQLIA